MDADSKPKGDKHTDVLERALTRFDEAVIPQIPVRRVALIARQIAAIPGALWDGAFGDQFEQVVKLDVHKLNRAIRKAETDYRQNRIVPDFKPAGGNSDNDSAATLDGLHRADSQHYKAQQARDNAFSEMASGGFGAYRMTNEWADPLDKDSDDQRINPASAIVDADQSVFFDPGSSLYDKSDARYAFVIRQLTPEAFKREYPNADCSGWPEGVTRYSQWDGWYRPDFIAVAEYYEVDERDETLLVFEFEPTGEERREWEKDIEPEHIADLKALGWTMRKRTVKRRRCSKYILSGAEVLDDRGYIAGGNIPIVPVYGQRAYVNGVEWFTGLLTSSKIDAARLYASMVSRLAEIQALSPHEKPIFDPEQLPPNLQELWARSNVDRHPYALAKVLRNEDGSIAQAGPIGMVNAPQVPQTIAALLEIANRDVTEDDQDGAEQVKANTSADAMDIAAARVDAKSAVLLDNNRQSVQREGELYLAMAREVYVEPGRVVETMTEDGDDGEATLHEDFYDGDVLKTRNDFATGKYKVIAGVTEATATRRDRTVKQMLSYAEMAVGAQDMEGAQAALITASMNMDGEGLDDFQKWQRKRALSLGLVEPTEDEQREMAEQQANAQQQPDPATVVAAAQAKALEAGAAKDAATAQSIGIKTQAEAQDRMANAALKMAQAEAVGGPEQAPAAPSGLSPANDDAQIEERFASAELKRAQAEHLRDDMDNKRIKTGHQIKMERRQQEQAERAPAA